LMPSNWKIRGMRTAWLCPFLNNLAAIAVMAIPSCLENLELVYALYMQGFKDDSSVLPDSLCPK
jgi:hypothetical protein